MREHVWTEPFHKIDRKYPFGFWRWYLCERGTCWNCLNHRCDLCVHWQKGGPDLDGLESVHNQRGRHIAWLIERSGGEPCVWWCRCSCPKTGEPPARLRSAPTPRSPSAVSPCEPEVQTALFEL